VVSDPGASSAFRALVHAPARELREHMARGTPPPVALLAGCEFRGANTPKVTRALGIRRFIKGFQQTGQDGLTGYNVRVRGADLTAAWTAARWGGRREYAYFLVTAVDPASHDSRYPNALLLDYGKAAAGPARLLRDYLVLVDQDRPLMLGQAFLAVGPMRLPVGYFALEPM
jgi:hypothetical protein